MPPLCLNPLINNYHLRKIMENNPIHDSYRKCVSHSHKPNKKCAGPLWKKALDRHCGALMQALTNVEPWMVWLSGLSAGL